MGQSTPLATLGQTPPPHAPAIAGIGSCGLPLPPPFRFHAPGELPRDVAGLVDRELFAFWLMWLTAVAPNLKQSMSHGVSSSFPWAPVFPAGSKAHFLAGERRMPHFVIGSGALIF